MVAPQTVVVVLEQRQMNPWLESIAVVLVAAAVGNHILPSVRESIHPLGPWEINWVAEVAAVVHMLPSLAFHTDWEKDLRAVRL